jgi:hypothetical protein
MPAQNSTCLEITDASVAEILIKEQMSFYLTRFIGAEISIAKAAEQASVKLNVMAYWVAKFVKLGLVRQTRIETRGGSAIKYFQSVAEEFVISVHLFEKLTDYILLQHIQKRDYDRFCHNSAAAGLRMTPDWRLRLFRDSNGYGLHLEPVFQAPPNQPIHRPLNDYATIAMPAEQAAEFYTELQALFERFRSTVHLQNDLPNFMMHVGFVQVTE